MESSATEKAKRTPLPNLKQHHSAKSSKKFYLTGGPDGKPRIITREVDEAKEDFQVNQDDEVKSIEPIMAQPNGQIPPVLPPSVEDAYHRKCIQLKQRIREVEESNEATRVRIARSTRGIEKMRLERAFLLEQLAKRTSTNVEDSEGSPSPPPTPKEKPLRTKRGHRKPEFLNNLEASRSVFQQAQGANLSPSNSDTFPSKASAAGRPPVNTFATTATGTNGASASAPPKKPRNAFEMFVSDNRSVQMVKHRNEIKAGTYNVDREIVIMWQNLTPDQKEVYTKEFQREYADAKEGSHEEDKDEPKDEDTEMGEQGEDEADA